MHIDLNACFATIEQQANPHLRNKPVAVAAYATSNGCILAASYEAKRKGVKTGMRVKDGKLFCPGLIVLSPDPWKYRNIHLALRRLLKDYTYKFAPKSIDEFILNFEGFPAFDKGMFNVGREIKKRIKKEIGDYLTVSIGIGPNRFLAKVASNLEKPDGLTEINITNYKKVFKSLALTDLWGIKTANAARLANSGINDVWDFYNADVKTLTGAFSSINGYYWYLRLKGWEVDDVEFGRRSYGNSYSLPKPFYNLSDISPILSKLVTKMSTRLRKAGFKASGVHVAIAYRDGDFAHKGISFEKDMFSIAEIYKKAFYILSHIHKGKPVRMLAVSSFNLKKITNMQLDLFEDVLEKRNLSHAIDDVNERWGDFVITPARMLPATQNVPDRIAFGNIKELEEFTLS